MQDPRNLDIKVLENGKVTTNDPSMNRILDQVQEDGKTLGMFVPAITFIDNPDQKVYMIVMKAYDWNDPYNEANDWHVKVGRQPTYEFLRSLIVNEEIDPNRSFIIGGELTEATETNRESIEFNSPPITVFRFMKVMAETEKVIETTGFDINEYSIEEIGGESRKEDISLLEFINE